MKNLRISRRDVLRSATAATLLSAAGIKPARAGAEIVFQTIGDWGSAGAAQRAVASAMGVVAEAHGNHFVISTGDNFYPNGVTGPEDTRFGTVFEQTYDAAGLQVPWNVVLGNHDHKGDVQAQIDYSSVSPRWRMPARYYKRTEIFDGGAADFFYLDTYPILTAHESWVRLFHDPAEEQLAWLERELARSQAPWKIVVGHHPVFSDGKHGSSPAMIALVRPLLERYGVQAYINGHNHNLEHVVVGDVHYLTSGGAARPSPGRTFASGRFGRATLGFLNARLSAGQMQVEFFDETARSLHRSTVPLGA